MSLYLLEWVFRYLPVVLTVFTKVNHSHKVQKYVIIPSGECIKIPTLGPYSFTKVNHSHKVQKVCHYTKWSGYNIPTCGPYSFY